MPKISIVVPMYKVEKYIGRCIESCINQTFKDIEIILINDESPDNCLNIANEYAKKDSRIKVINQKNSGVSVARNQGIENAKSNWIMFVDGDDWLEENATEKLYKEIEKDDKWDIIITSFYTNRGEKQVKDHFFNDENIIFKEDENIELVKNCICKTDISNESSATNVGVPWAKIYNRNFIIKNKCRFQPGLKRMQDMIFNLKAFYLAKKVKSIDILTYHYRINEGSVTKKFTKDFDVTVIEILRAINNFINENNLQDKLQNYYDAKAIKLFLEMIRIQYAPDGLKMNNYQKIKVLQNKLKSNEYKGHINLKNQKLLNKKEKIMNFLINLKMIGIVYYLYRIKYLKNK